MNDFWGAHSDMGTYSCIFTDHSSLIRLEGEAGAQDQSIPLSNI